MSEPKNLRSQAVAGVMWTALQKWSVRLSTFVAFLMLGRLLSPEEFGIVALASAFVLLLAVVADAGFATYLVQARTLTDAAVNASFWIATGAGAVLTALLSALAFPLAALFGVPELRRVLPVLALSLVLIGLSSVPAALLSREMRFQQLAARQVVATVLSVIAAVALAVAGAGVWALVAQTLVRNVVATVMLATATSFRPRWAFDVAEGRAALSYSSRAMGAHVTAQMREQGEALLIGGIAGPVALGLWTVASRLVLVIGDLLGTVLGAVAMPLFAKVQNDPERLSRAIASISSIGCLILAPAFVALALTSGDLVPFAFGSQWQSAATIAALLAVRGIFNGVASLDRAVLLNAGQAGSELRLSVVLTVVHCAVVAAVAPLGMEVLAAVLLVEAVLFVPLRPRLLRRLLGVPYSTYSGAARVSLAAAVAGGLALLVLRGGADPAAAQHMTSLAVGAVAYLGLLVVLARQVLVELRSTLDLVRRRRPPGVVVL